ncbi:MAG: IS256 family transposase [Phycisphaerae bacterium]
MKRIVSQEGQAEEGQGRKSSPGDRYRKELLQAVGAASLDFSGYCRLAAQAMLQSAMEIELQEFVGRASYQRRADDQSAYRNGYKRRRVATGEGAVELHVPQTRAGREPFQTAILEAYRRRSETLEAMIPRLFVKGLSVRDVSDTFQQVFEDEGISPATASRVGRRIYEDFDTWRRRSLSGLDVLYLFVDGMHLKLDPQREQKQPVLLAYGILWDGRKVLLHVDVGDREGYEACLGFLREMTERGLRPPLLYASDDCPGLRKALKAVWPRSLPQKCQAHKMRNVLGKLPPGVQGEMKRQIQRVFRAETYQQGLARGRKLVADYRERYPNAMGCLAKSLAECITCLKLPAAHRRRVRTTNTLERLIEEARRRTKVIGPLAGERSGLSLIHAVLVDVSQRWHGIKLTPGDLEKLNALRREVAPLAATG